MDNVKIMSESDLKVLYRFRQIWIIGWVAALIAGLVAFWALGQFYGLKVGLKELTELKDQVKEVQAQQEKVTASYVKAWSVQQATADALLSWGEFSIEKKSLIDMNRNAVSSIGRTK